MAEFLPNVLKEKPKANPWGSVKKTKEGLSLLQLQRAELETKPEKRLQGVWHTRATNGMSLVDIQNEEAARKLQELEDQRAREVQTSVLNAEAQPFSMSSRNSKSKRRRKPNPSTRR
jgi:hypothetical protein